jgi:hypothetical protein
VALAAIVITLGLSFGTIFMALVIAALLVGAAYAIAQGGTQNPSTPADATQRWASDTLAVPFWVEVAANSVEWTALITAVAYISTWGAPISAAWVVFALFVGALVTAPVAVAFAAWERRDARRALAAEPR